MQKITSRTHYRKYSPTSLGTAYEKVLSKEMSAYKASKVYGIPKSTLMDRLKGRVDSETLSSGPPPMFTLEQESKLVDHVKKMASLGYGYTRTEVTGLATDFAIELGLRQKHDKSLSLQWFRSFLERWPEIKSLRPRSLALSRAKAASQETIDAYFEQLESIMDKYNLKDKPQCIYNIDEKGVTPDHKPPNVIGDSNARKSTPAITSENYNWSRQCNGHSGATIFCIRRC